MWGLFVLCERVAGKYIRGVLKKEWVSGGKLVWVFVVVVLEWRVGIRFAPFGKCIQYNK